MKKRNPEFMVKLMEEEFKVEKYKSHYLIPQLKQINCSMKIFSYLWTLKDAPRHIGTINSKGYKIMKNTFQTTFSQEFSKHSKTQNFPRSDLLFDDILDLQMTKSKETQIHSITFYHTPMKIVGFEIEYFLDGGILVSVNHHISPMVLFKKAATKDENVVVDQFQKGIDKLQTPEAQFNFTKTSYYLEQGEHINAVKLRGNTHINKIEMKTTKGKSIVAGGGLQKDREVDLEIPKGKIVIGFAGVIDGFEGDCRLLNLSAAYKAPQQDNVKAKSTENFRDLVEKPFFFFDVFKDPEHADKIARLQSIQIYKGSYQGNSTIGGIEIEYLLTTGEIFVDGIRDLSCKTSEEFKRFELKDNEGLINVEGTGRDSVNKLTFESSFGRKIKEGMLAKLKEMSEEDAGSKGGLLAQLQTVAVLAKQENQADKFTLTMPVGSKVIGFGGTADDQIRCIYAYYKN